MTAPAYEIRIVDRVLPRAASRAPSLLGVERWTPAHTEAARFVGECFAVGAVLGLFTELARPVWDKRRA